MFNSDTQCFEVLKFKLMNIWLVSQPLNPTLSITIDTLTPKVCEHTEDNQKVKKILVSNVLYIWLSHIFTPKIGLKIHMSFLPNFILDFKSTKYNKTKTHTSKWLNMSCYNTVCIHIGASNKFLSWWLLTWEKKNDFYCVKYI